MNEGGQLNSSEFGLTEEMTIQKNGNPIRSVIAMITKPRIIRVILR
jgi:hypothetical protein